MRYHLFLTWNSASKESVVVFKFEVESRFHLVHVSTKCSGFPEFELTISESSRQSQSNRLLCWRLALQLRFLLSVPKASGCQLYLPEQHGHCFRWVQSLVASMSINSSADLLAKLVPSFQHSQSHILPKFHQPTPIQFRSSWPYLLVGKGFVGDFKKKGIWNQTWKHQTSNLFRLSYTHVLWTYDKRLKKLANWLQTHVKWAYGCKVSNTVVVHNTVNFYFQRYLDTDCWNSLWSSRDNLLCTFCFSRSDNTMVLLHQNSSRQRLFLPFGVPRAAASVSKPLCFFWQGEPKGQEMTRMASESLDFSDQILESET